MNPAELMQKMQAYLANPHMQSNPAVLNSFMNPALMAQMTTGAMTPSMASGLINTMANQQSPLSNSPPTSLSPSSKLISRKKSFTVFFIETLNLQPPALPKESLELLAPMASLPFPVKFAEKP